MNGVSLMLTAAWLSVPSAPVVDPADYAQGQRAADGTIWEFSVPCGAIASVVLPGESVARIYGPGSHRVER